LHELIFGLPFSVDLENYQLSITYYLYLFSANSSTNLIPTMQASYYALLLVVGKANVSACSTINPFDFSWKDLSTYIVNNISRYRFSKVNSTMESASACALKRI